MGNFKLTFHAEFCKITFITEYLCTTKKTWMLWTGRQRPKEEDRMRLRLWWSLVARWMWKWTLKVLMWKMMEEDKKVHFVHIQMRRRQKMSRLWRDVQTLVSACNTTSVLVLISIHRLPQFTLTLLQIHRREQHLNKDTTAEMWVS